VLCCIAIALPGHSDVVQGQCKTGFKCAKGTAYVHVDDVNSQKAETDWVQSHTTQTALRATAHVAKGSSSGQKARPQPMSLKAAVVGKRQGHSLCNKGSSNGQKGKAYLKTKQSERTSLLTWCDWLTHFHCHFHHQKQT